VLETERRLINAWVASDVDTLDELLDENYQFTTADHPESKRQRLQALRSDRLRYTFAQPSDQEIRHYGDVCVVTSRIDIAGERDGTKFRGRYRSVRIYKRGNKNWRAVAGQLVCQSSAA
jgi:hypothetical protein